MGAFDNLAISGTDETISTNTDDDGGGGGGGGGGGSYDSDDALDAFNNIDTSGSTSGSSDSSDSTDNNLDDDTQDAFDDLGGDDEERSTSSDSGIGGVIDDATEAATDAVDDAASAADESAGGADEATGGALDAVTGAFDSVTGGSSDSSSSNEQADEAAVENLKRAKEATPDAADSATADEAAAANLKRAAAETPDAAAADTDDEKKTVAEKIGGFVTGSADKAADAAGDGYAAGAGGADFVAGSTDEALARSTDGTEGGGIADGTADATGVTDLQRRDDFQRIQDDYAATEGDTSIDGHLTRANLATSAGMDFLLDNPNASVQEGVKGAAKAPTELATGRDISDEELAGSAVDVATKFREATAGATEGTAADNWAVDGAAWVGDAVVADPLKNVAEAASGVDVDAEDGGKGEARLNAAETGTTLFDAALLGSGSAAAGGARAALSGSDEAGGLAARLLGRGADDAASGASGADGIGTDWLGRLQTGDDAAGSSGGLFSRFGGGTAATAGASAADEGAGLLDDAGSAVDDLTSRLTGGADDAAGAGDDVASGADDVAGAGDDASIGDRLTDVRRRVFGGADEAAGVGDDAAGGADDAAGGADEAGGASDDVGGGGSGADDGGDLFNIGTGTKIAGGIGGGLVGGATLLEFLRNQGEVTLTDPSTGETFTLTKTKQYPPTDRHVDGGTLWRVAVDKGGSVQNKGLTVIVGVQGRNVVILDGEGNETKAQVPISTFKEAMQAGRSGGASA